MFHQQKTAVYVFKKFVSFVTNLFSFKGLLKEIIREGSGDETPMFDDKVFIHYTGTHLDGTVFESSRDRTKKVSFNVGKGDVLKAWEIGVATMKRGEIARFLSKPKYAYGLKGLDNKVPSATSVIFEIELFDFEGKSKCRILIIKDIGSFSQRY
jgi:FK506-binding protein 4/5